MYKQVRIDGIETYLFLPEELEDILRDSSKLPVYCLEMGKTYYHVGFRERWHCRDCGTEYGPVLLHQMEVDTVLYIGRKWPQIPKFFAKQYCSKCGHMMQGHLFMLSKKE